MEAALCRHEGIVQAVAAVRVRHGPAAGGVLVFADGEDLTASDVRQHTCASRFRTS
ncbi:MAG: hypothetical protein R2712_17110 [Vicinamibacterales bacterium]